MWFDSTHPFLGMKGKGMTIKEKFDSIDYGYDRLERVTVQIPESALREIITKLAREKVLADGKLNVEDWGRSIQIKDWHDGLGFKSGKYGEVIFTRRVEEEELEGTEDVKLERHLNVFCPTCKECASMREDGKIFCLSCGIGERKK